MKFENYMILEFPSKSANESFARSAVACFAAQMDPTLEEMGDIRTAVSEAVTNCIVHAYPEELGMVKLRLRLYEDNTIEIMVKDKGVGIPDVARARELIDTGLIAGGMIPKTMNCIHAVEHGVGAVTVLDGHMDHAVLLEAISEKSLGTTIEKRR